MAQFNDIHPSVKFGKGVIVRNFVYIGEGTVVGNATKIANFCNIDKRCRIGQNCNLQSHVNLNDDTVVGDNTFIAGYTLTVDELYPKVGIQYRTPRKIGKNCVIGTHSVIGADVGDNSVVAAGSVITKPVPPNMVVKGMGRKLEIIADRHDYDRKHLQDAMDVEWYYTPRNP